jgi:hypothetical protein
MLGLPFASVGAAGATAAASPDAAVGGTVVDPAAIFESALGTPAGFGVAGLAEANVAGAGGVAGGTALVEAVAGALLDCVSAGATGALAATDRVRNTGMADEPARLPGETGNCCQTALYAGQDPRPGTVPPLAIWASPSPPAELTASGIRAELPASRA